MSVLWDAVDFLLGYLLVAAFAVALGWGVATLIKNSMLGNAGSALVDLLRLGGLS